ncbi:MAG: thiamine ABC transporter substrate-binding protein [Anaerolineae bacterium]|nr:thiamine ABC transporter substrate-binding protein [Anaerolineae bacterium]MDW8173228.1 thiamine ABC transporter substrate-binding protein [Anaerolineae bacterium]
MKFLSIFVLVLSLSLSAQGQERVVTLITHDSFNVSEDVLQAFEQESGYRVEILRLGDAGLLVNQAILSRNNPLGDVLFGVDNTFLSRALKADIFLPYESPLLAEVDPIHLLPDETRVTPIDYGDVCLNYDIAALEALGLKAPQSLADLTQEAYRGLLVAMNPATSSPGLAFLLTTVSVFGTEGDYTYLDYWADLVANDVLIVDDWETAYFGHFSAISEDGDRPLVVSYASSPPFSLDDEGQPTTASVTAPGTCFRQVEYAAMLRGTDNEEGAQQLIDFMLSRAFQEDLPMQMYVFPVRRDAVLPAEFAEFATVAEEPAMLSAEAIDQGREDWINAWLEVIVRR